MLKGFDQFQPLRCVAILAAHTSHRLLKRVSYGIRKALAMWGCCYAYVYPLAYLCMGYVSEFLDQPELEAKGWRSRLPLEELVHRNGWGAGLDDKALLEQLKT